MFKKSKILAFLIFIVLILALLFFFLFYGCGYVGTDGTVITTTTTIPDSGRRWGTPSLIASDVGNNPYPRVAMDDSGGAMILWHSKGDLHTLNSGSGSATWETAGKINSVTGGISDYRLVMDADGNALAVWSQKRTGEQYFDIYTNRYVAGAGWGSDDKIEALAGDSKEVKLAISEGGDAVAVWVNNALSGKLRVCSSVYTSGDGWNSVEVISEMDDETASCSAAMNYRGDAIVVWDQNDLLGITHVHAKRYIKGAGWGAVEDAENYSESAAYPRVVIDSSGNAVAVWVANSGIYSTRSSAGGGAWGDMELLDPWFNAMDLFADRSSNAILVWLYNTSIFVKRYEAGAWGPNRLINLTQYGNFSWRFSAAAGGNDDLMVIWTQPYNDSLHIWANRYDAAQAKWGTASLVETLQGFCDWPEVAMDGNGNATAVWLQFFLGKANIYSNRYR